MKLSHSQAPQQQPNKQTKQNKTKQNKNNLPRNVFPQKQKHKTLNSATTVLSQENATRGWAGIRNGATRSPPSGSHVGSNNTNNAPKVPIQFSISILFRFFILKMIQ
jgi:hypothetical protein